MPNKIRDDKVKVGYLELAEVEDELKKIAREEGIHLPELLRRIHIDFANKHLKKRGRKIINAEPAALDRWGNKINA